MPTQWPGDRNIRVKPSGRWMVFLAASFALGLIFTYMIIREERSRAMDGNRTVPTIGKVPSTRDLPGIDGAIYTFDQYKGQPLVVNFWGTWCKHCREEMTLFEQYSQSYADEYAMLGINTLDSKETIESFLQEYGITFNIVTDRDGTISDFYYVSGFPTTFFIDSEGILKAKHVGSLTEKQLNKYLAMIDVGME